MSETKPKRLLIFIVAYNAQTTIRSVLQRIPFAELPWETEVLIIDDQSADRTFETALRHREALGGIRVTVLANPLNQGYGGNQKMGYRYAVEHGFDVVALLHGDGQYAPEKLPDLVAPVAEGKADACFGSRMLEGTAALKGGMPFYKYVGNRVLTAFQNRMLGMALSEFHSGYRVYAVDALKAIPFRYNTHDFHFDTEIIIQFHLAKRTIMEVPIPTFYGDEICHVNGMAYAWRVVMATLGSRLHGMGLFYQRKFDVAPEGARREAKIGYLSSHTMAVDAVPPDSSVLECGCGSGAVAAALRRKGCRVTGFDSRPADSMEGFADFVRHALDALPWPDRLGDFDTILVLDRIEHLNRPEDVLAEMRRRCYAGRTRVILTAPNIGFFMVRIGLLLGQFNYGRQGILDLTHKRLFTFRSFRDMVEQEGYSVIRMRGIPAPFPKAIGNGAAARILLAVNRALLAVLPGWFAYQIYAEARFTPPLERLLKRTLESSRERTARASEGGNGKLGEVVAEQEGEQAARGRDGQADGRDGIERSAQDGVADGHGASVSTGA
jgi:glycosyltransferase involved in cell wall biosynthesis